MGTRSLPLILFPPSATRRPSIYPKSFVYRRPNFSSNLPRSSPNSGTVLRARWDFEGETTRSERFGTGSKFDFTGDVDSRFGFKSREKRRSWWSDEDDDEDCDDDDSLFGLWEDPRTTDFVLKVLRTFGWIVPNIIMSSMLDTGDKGQDAIIMMMIIPLGQLAISFTIDRIQESSGYTRNPKRKKRKPRRRTSSRTGSGDRTRKRSYQTAQEGQVYYPWSETDANFSKNGTKRSSNFGGWDELDQQVDNISDFHGSSPREDENSKEVRNVQKSHDS